MKSSVEWEWTNSKDEPEHRINLEMHMQLHEYLFVCLWCWMTKFFSWMVSSRAVARDLRSWMDWGVAGRLQPCSSRSISCTERKKKKDKKHFTSCKHLHIPKQSKCLYVYVYTLGFNLCIHAAHSLSFGLPFVSLAITIQLYVFCESLCLSFRKQTFQFQFQREKTTQNYHKRWGKQHERSKREMES